MKTENGLLIEENSKEIILNINQKNFADLILNFLGKKEKLSYHIENDNFTVGRNDLEQFYYLLEEKIEKENYTSISYFSVVIAYNDNTKRQIIGIENFNKYAEMRDVTPKSVTLTWNIILDFPTTETIENQIIELSFNLIDDENSEIILNIEHTNQAWGIEVLNLFQLQIKSLTSEKIKKYEYAKKVISNITGKRGRLNLLFLSLFVSLLLSFINLNILQEKQKIVNYKFNAAKIDVLSNIMKEMNDREEISIAYNLILII